jgi:hypothetical protein
MLPKSPSVGINQPIHQLQRVPSTPNAIPQNIFTGM